MMKLGVDPVHFGVIFTLNLLIGLLTPPFGASMFLVVRIGKITMNEFLAEGRPFILALVVLLFLLTFFPGIVLLLLPPPRLTPPLQRASSSFESWG